MSTDAGRALTPEEERLLRFARSINGAPIDASPSETVDRLLATLDAEREAAQRAIDELLTVERVAAALHGVHAGCPWNPIHEEYEAECRPAWHEAKAAMLIAELRKP